MQLMTKYRGFNPSPNQFLIKNCVYFITFTTQVNIQIQILCVTDFDVKEGDIDLPKMFVVLYLEFNIEAA